MSLATGVTPRDQLIARSPAQEVGVCGCYVTMSFRPPDRTLIPRSYPESLDTEAGITRMY